jgi:hypothetical protein
LLSQTGRVPDDAKAIQFLWQGEDLRLFVNDTQVPVIFWESRASGDSLAPVHNYYGADIRQYAGQEVTLRFEFRANEPHAFPDWPGRVQVLDNIQFSPIPEPSALSLGLLGLGALWLGRRWCTRRAGADVWRL